MPRLKVKAYYALHYGIEYLKWSILSIAEAVDHIAIVYSREPSWGMAATLPNPEPQERVYAEYEEIKRALGPLRDKLGWWEGTFTHEGHHRNMAHKIASPDADMVLSVDADEVWDPYGLEEAIALAWAANAAMVRCCFQHFWRSFDWVCTDAMMPIRFLRGTGSTEAYIQQSFPVNHFGYAQSPALVEYKSHIHAHRGEWKDGWFERDFMAWRPGDVDVHPTCEGIWTPEPYDRYKLPMVMRDHPYWGKELIT